MQQRHLCKIWLCVCSIFSIKQRSYPKFNVLQDLSPKRFCWSGTRKSLFCVYVFVLFLITILSFTLIIFISTHKMQVLTIIVRALSWKIILVFLKRIIVLQSVKLNSLSYFKALSFSLRRLITWSVYMSNNNGDKANTYYHLSLSPLPFIIRVFPRFYSSCNVFCQCNQELYALLRDIAFLQ